MLKVSIIGAFLCLLIKYGNINRNQLEKSYISKWNKEFKWRLKAGHFIAALFRKDWIANVLLRVIQKLPFLLLIIIKQTHGKSIKM